MTEREQILSCRPDQLLLFHYGELDSADRLWIEQHLQQCAACRAELAELQLFLNRLPEVGSELGPAEVRRFGSRVMAQLPSNRRHFSRPALGWSLAGAALLLITLNLPGQFPSEVPQPPKRSVKMSAEQKLLPDPDMLQNLDLLDNFDLVQKLDRLG